METVTGKVTHVEHLGCSAAGNPRFKVTIRTSGPSWINEHPYKLQDNCSLAYEIENPEFRIKEHTFILSKAGRIVREANK